MGRLRDLRIWLVGSPGLAADLSSACAIDALAPDSWRNRVSGTEADLLLVEGGEHVERVWEGNVEALLRRCRQAHVPCLLWITASPLSPAWVNLCSRFDRVFSIDREDLSTLEAAGGRGPSPLWEATALAPDSWPPLDASRQDAVVWLGGWRTEWPREWRDRLWSVLEGAAAYGLKIVGVEDPEVLPSVFRPYASASGQVDRQAVLRRARVVIGADRERGSLRIAPSVVFDAVACGAAVITPHGFPYNGAFSIQADGGVRHLIPVVRDAASAAAEVERLLSDEALRRDTVHRSRQIVAYNHTYSHRVATLATAVGVRIIPDVT